MRLTERSFACVKLHLQHTLLHGFEVTDELQEGLDLLVQLGGFLFGCSVTRGLVLLLQRNGVISTLFFFFLLRVLIWRFVGFGFACVSVL